MKDLDNIARIRTVFTAFGDLGDKIVFVGGAVVSLYRDRPASETRITEDVDVVVEVAKYTDYADLEDQLRKKGFVNEIESGVLCRYKIKNIVVDIIPTHEEVLGFKNKWYKDGFKNSIDYRLDENTIVKIFSSDYFMASKMDAFNDRGNGDGRTSADFEDIVYILNNRITIWEEMKNAPEKLRSYLSSEFKKWMEEGYIHEWISCHLEYAEQRRAEFIVKRLADFINE